MRVAVTENLYEIDGVVYPRVTRCLERLGVEWLEKWRVRVGREEADRITAEAADYGGALHELTAAYDAGDEESYLQLLIDSDGDPRLVAALESWVRWEKALGVEWVAVECLLVSRKYGFAGTADRVGRVPGESRLVIVDKKTGWLSDSTGCQLTAYKIAWNESHKRKRDQVDRLLAVRIPRDMPEKVTVKEYDSRKYEGVLLREVDQYRALMGLGKP